MIVPTRRQVLLGSSAILAATALPSLGRSQAVGPEELRIATIVPSTTGLTVIRTSINDYIGDAARQGALTAEAIVGDEALANGTRLVHLTANAPNPVVAERAGRRIVATGDVNALVGGVGEGQAEVLSAVAEEAGIPFFNVGSPSIALRQKCRRFTFHIEASAAMYLDAMVIWSASQGHRRWFIVYESGDDGEQMRTRAVRAVSNHGEDGEVVGASSAVPFEPYYGRHFEAARAVGADAMLVLVSDVDQITLAAQQESVGISMPLVLFPHPNTQTRDYLAVARRFAPETNPDHRFAVWDTTLVANGAEEFNTRYLTRWGSPADPPAWSAYHAVKIMYEATRAIGTSGGAAIVDYLENSGVEFNLLKGPGTSFRSWDHQLRQPLYLVRVDRDAVWERTQPTTQAAIAAAVGTLPTVEEGANPALAFDQLGDGPDGLVCA